MVRGRIDVDRDAHGRPMTILRHTDMSTTMISMRHVRRPDAATDVVRPASDPPRG
jgi:hypothetical protein